MTIPAGRRVGAGSEWLRLGAVDAVAVDGSEPDVALVVSDAVDQFLTSLNSSQVPEL